MFNICSAGPKKKALLFLGKKEAKKLFDSFGH
jgi:hypothetical protein